MKYGSTKARRRWVKVHLITSVKTNTVTAVEIYNKYTNDCPMLPPLVETTARGFKIREVSADIDELGVLLYGHARNAYWYGSQLSVEETRALAPYQNATGMQVTSAVLAGMVWALENPRAGIVEADELDFRRCLEIQTPYLGPVIGAYTDWTPLVGRPGLFPRGHRRERSMAVPQRSGGVII